jgi:hypothetical protein
MRQAVPEVCRDRFNPNRRVLLRLKPSAINSLEPCLGYRDRSESSGMAAPGALDRPPGTLLAARHRPGSKIRQR